MGRDYCETNAGYLAQGRLRNKGHLPRHVPVLAFATMPRKARLRKGTLLGDEYMYGQEVL
jgi:hypothetical protein